MCVFFFLCVCVFVVFLCVCVFFFFFLFFFFFVFCLFVFCLFVFLLLFIIPMNLLCIGHLQQKHFVVPFCNLKRKIKGKWHSSSITLLYSYLPQSLAYVLKT